ncbi:MAG: acyl-CoA thioesterase [Desulfobacterales bacterium]|jgi:acyl-CoA hydrolase|nr:acyl-CoA thioesterase [Desulfobacterales bacterium]
MQKREKTPSDSQSYMAQIVGVESLLGQRMFAGELLHMMDFAAADAAIRHAESTLVTLAFDRIELLDYVYHRDYVRYDACVIQVGRSSIVVRLDGFAKSPTDMTIRPGNSGFITMVAIDENGKPNKNIPALIYKSAADLDKKRMAEKRERQIRENKRDLDKIEALTALSSADLKDFFPRDRLYAPADTILSVRKRFLPRNTNNLGIVFGGDTVQLMEELALSTARQFTGNIRMVTIAMEDVVFLKPLYVTDLMEMTSQVVFVAGTTLMVKVTVRAMDLMGKGKNEITNSGTFTVLNYDASGGKTPIPNGLNLAGTDLAFRKCYFKEQMKYESRTGLAEKP